MSARSGFNSAFGACGGIVAFIVIAPLLFIGGCAFFMELGDQMGKVTPEYIPAPTAAEAQEIIKAHAPRPHP